MPQPIPLPELHDPDHLTKEKVDAAIPPRTPGFYVLGTLGDNKVMSVSFVGRSDDDLAGKLKRHAGLRWDRVSEGPILQEWNISFPS